MTSESYTETLRQAAGEQWDPVIHHRFTKELAAGTIDRNGKKCAAAREYGMICHRSLTTRCRSLHVVVLKKYLIQDHRFLDAFVIQLASMVANARTLEDRIPGCQFLALITGKENTYFERSFEKFGGCTVDERNQIPNAPCATGFIHLMKTVAKEGSLGYVVRTSKLD